MNRLLGQFTWVIPLLYQHSGIQCQQLMKFYKAIQDVRSADIINSLLLMPGSVLTTIMAEYEEGTIMEREFNESTLCKILFINLLN